VTYERDVHQEFIGWIKDGIGDDSIHINGGIQTHIQFNCLGRPAAKGNGHHRSAMLRIFAGHGYGGGRKAGAGPLSIEDLLKTHNVDLLFAGHRHKPSYHEEMQIDSSKGGKLFVRYRVGFVVPSYRSKPMNEFDTDEVISDYADLKLLPPSATGGVRVEFDVEHNRIVNPFRAFE
jgi:hypothetical protein